MKEAPVPYVYRWQREENARSKVAGSSKENPGYPGSAEDIALFEKLLKETAPGMTDEQRSATMKHFLREGA